ncbi:MAG: DUF1931 domain-containing protein [Candidatus Aenigmarchaeota archaeon]|nr:DUF1931 domain-containing protein [Candidatus Aenigmarchaeota archaeon]
MANYVVESKVKALIKTLDMNCAGDFCDALDKVVEDAVKKAADRSKSNDRKTVRNGDL